MLTVTEVGVGVGVGPKLGLTGWVRARLVQARGHADKAKRTKRVKVFLMLSSRMMRKSISRATKKHCFGAVNKNAGDP